LVGIELQLSHQTQPITRGQLGSGSSGQLFDGGSGVVSERGVLNGLSRLSRHDDQHQSGEQATPRSC
jgi:hypothetical protein